MKRDRERFRAALKDLKDYEIYKEVMEAAMVRMQQELESYAGENAAIRASKQQEDRQIKKHKEYVQCVRCLLYCTVVLILLLLHNAWCSDSMRSTARIWSPRRRNSERHRLASPCWRSR